MNKSYLFIFVILFNSCEHSPKSKKEVKVILLSGRYCSAFDTIDHKGCKIVVDLPSKRQLDEVNKILSRISLPKNFILYQGKVNNAIALFQDNQNYIILNRDFLNNVDKKSSSYWLSMYLISHEIGHLLSSHLLTENVNDSVSKAQELQADYFAGATLSRLKCPLDKAKLIFNGTDLQKVQGSPTHPSSPLRMEYIENGWENNLKNIYTESDPPLPDNIDEVDPNNPNYTFNVRDLSQLHDSDFWIHYKTNNYRDNIGEGVILSVEPLEQDDLPNADTDDYEHSNAQFDTIEKMMDIYPSLHSLATIKVKKWITTSSDVSLNTSVLKIYFKEDTLPEDVHPYNRYLNLFRFAYNKEKLKIYEDHFIEGQPIRFTAKNDNWNQRIFYFKEFSFLPR